jgi:hypothetical protein
MSAKDSAEISAAAQNLRQLMCAVQERSTHFVRDIHPQWGSAALPDFDGLLSRCEDGVSITRMSLILADYYNVEWPNLLALRNKVNRIALLAAPAAKRVLAAAALYAGRAGVRRCIARHDRLAMIALVGEPAYVGIRDAPDTGGLQLAMEFNNFQPDTWANKGYGLLQMSDAKMCIKSSRIAQLILNPIETDQKVSEVKPKLGCYDFIEFINQLDIFFPELTWLFGLDMDQVLSE